LRPNLKIHFLGI